MYSWMAKFGVASPTCVAPARVAGGGVCWGRPPPQPLWVLGRGQVLEPVQVHWFDGLTEPRRLVGCEPVVRVVQQSQIRADVLADLDQYARHVAQIGIGVPDLLDRPDTPARRFVGGAVLRHAVHGVQAWHPGLHTDGLEAPVA